MPAARAISRPPASGRFDSTSTISAGKLLSFAASISAALLEPRPEMRMAPRLRLMPSPEIEFAVVDDARLVGGAHHFAKSHHAFARARESFGDRGGIFGRGDDDHADAAVEGAQHFVLRNIAFAGEPLEQRRHRHFAEIDTRAQALRQHARG